MTEDVKGFNDFFYVVLSDMEDLTRNIIDEPEDDDDREILAFCKKLKDAVSKMDRNIVFADNFHEFLSGLDPDEEDIMFYELAVYFYEAWRDLLQDNEMVRTDEEKMEAYSLVLASEIIVRQIDDYLGYGYFLDDDEEIVEEKKEN